MVSHPTLPSMLMLSCVIGLLLTSMLPAFAQNATIDSFNKAKKHMEQVFAGHETEFYCGCTYAGHEVNLASCGLTGCKF